jgi:DNA-binding ferritin-like protein
MNKTYEKRKNKHTRKNTSYNSLSRRFQQKITVRFLELLIMVKLYHWKTHSYVTHKASDELYSSLNSNIDKFIEVLLGKTNSRIDLNQKTISLVDLNSQERLIERIKECKTCLVDLNKDAFMNSMANTDLFSIRDEILGNLNQFLYLLSFH